MSGTPGEVSFSSVIERLFSTPNHASLLRHAAQVVEEAVAAPGREQRAHEAVERRLVGLVGIDPARVHLASRTAFCM